MSHSARGLAARVEAVLEKTRKVVAEADALVTRTRIQNARQRAEADTMLEDAEWHRRARASREHKRWP
jgi:hypothetical protein